MTTNAVKGKNYSVLAGLVGLSGMLFTAGAQPLAAPVLELQQGVSGAELVVAPDAEPSLLYIYEGQNLDALSQSPHLALITDMPTSGDLRLPVAYTNAARFFRGMRLHGDLSEAIGPDFDDPSDVTIAFWTLGLPDPLVSGNSYTADLLLFAGVSELVDFTGAANLSVIRLQDDEPHPDAVVTPNTISFVNGACRAQLTVAAVSSLVGYRIAVTLTLGDSSNLSPPDDGTVTAASGSTLTLKPILAFPDSPTDENTAKIKALENVQAIRDANESYSNPLSLSLVALPEVSGTFGEWRGRKVGGVNHNHTHAGLDFVAASPTPVRAARGGIVTAVGSEGGRFVTISHLDGWYSRYLHLATTGAPPVIGSYANRGDQIGVVGPKSQTGYSDHLHFELRYADNPGLSAGKPGIGRDPVLHPGLFSVRHASRLAILTDVGVTPFKSTTNDYQRPTQPVSGSDQTAFVVLQIVHPEPRADGGTAPRRLSPRAVRFQGQDAPQPILLTTTNENQTISLKPHQNPPNRGFANYTHGTTTTNDVTKWYKYWFQWDVSGYTSASNGPRTFSVTTTNYANLTTNYTLKWGPQILAAEPVGAPVNGEQRYRLRVRAWVGEDAATTPETTTSGAWTTGADWLRYELPPDGKWTANNSATREETAAVSGTQKFRTNDFLWPVSGGQANPTVTVRSRTTPSIAHNLEFLPDCPSGPVTPGPNMDLVPAGSFTMGNATDPNEYPAEVPLHTVYVSAFYMDKYEVTKALWDDVRVWANANGYDLGTVGEGKAPNHPVHSVNWYDVVKWCNARSEREGRVPAYYTSAAQTTVYRSGQVNVQNDWVKWCTGYRLPTEAEWEKAARGGVSGQRFPWGNTISHGEANYRGWPTSSGGHAFDLAPLSYHPTFNDGPVGPYTSPVGYFAANGYGLHDMAGNVMEWCWDSWSGTYYSSSPASDPRGPTWSGARVIRDGRWSGPGFNCRAANRTANEPGRMNNGKGFRSVLPPGQ